MDGLQETSTPSGPPSAATPLGAAGAMMSTTDTQASFDRLLSATGSVETTVPTT